MFKLLFSLLLFININEDDAKKIYHKQYYTNGNMQQQGWLLKSIKTDYWYSYYTNGVIQEEGAYTDGKRNKFWKFYNENGKKIKEGHFVNDEEDGWWCTYNNNMLQAKIEYKDGKRNGLVLLYKDGKLYKAEKYMDDKKIGEWTDYFAYKRDNPK